MRWRAAKSELLLGWISDVTRASDGNLKKKKEQISLGKQRTKVELSSADLGSVSPADVEKVVSAFVRGFISDSEVR